MDVQALVKLVTSIAQAAIDHTPAVLAAGDALIDFIRSVRPTLSQEDADALDAALPDLLVRMNRDVDQALADLRG